jgi:hypothetical protein
MATESERYKLQISEQKSIKITHDFKLKIELLLAENTSLSGADRHSWSD